MRRRYSDRKILSLTAFILLLAMLLSSCGQGTEPIPQDPVGDPDPGIGELVPPEPIETPSPMDDADENRKLVCVNVNSLRIRNAPAGDILYEETYDNKQKERHAQRIAYEYFEEAEADGYRWLRIGDGEWIATKPEWITESYYGENFSMDDPNARIEFVEGDGWAPFLRDEILGLLDSLGQDETQIALSFFLKKTMPGLLYDYYRPIEFDIENLTNEMIGGIFHQLFFHGPDMLINLDDYPELNHVREQYADVIMNNNFPDSSPDDIFERRSYPDETITVWDYCYGTVGILPIVLEEHMNYLSYKYYGKMIDFRTCTDMLLYDPVEHAFAVLELIADGYGAGNLFPYIESYSVDGDIITATVVPLITPMGEMLIVEDSSGIFQEASLEEALAWAKQKAEVTVKITESGGYQLLKVDVID